MGTCLIETNDLQILYFLINEYSYYAACSIFHHMMAGSSGHHLTQNFSSSSGSIELESSSSTALNKVANSCGRSHTPNCHPHRSQAGSRLQQRSIHTTGGGRRTLNRPPANSLRSIVPPPSLSIALKHALAVGNLSIILCLMMRHLASYTHFGGDLPSSGGCGCTRVDTQSACLLLALSLTRSIVSCSRQ